jgi:hypothetical protein
MPDAKNSAKGIGTETQVGIFTQKFQRMFFGLNRIFFRIGLSQQFNFGRPAVLHFARFPAIRPVFLPPPEQAPVFISRNQLFVKFVAVSATTCKLCIVEPSLRAIKFTFLLPRLVLTQPFASSFCTGFSCGQNFLYFQSLHNSTALLRFAICDKGYKSKFL